MKRKYRWAYLGVAGCIIIVNVLFIFIKAKSKNSLYEKYEWAEEFYGEKLYLNQRIIAGNAQFAGIAAGRGVRFTTGLLLLGKGLGMRETPIRPHSWH